MESSGVLYGTEYLIRLMALMPEAIFTLPSKIFISAVTSKDFTVETCFIGNWLIVAVEFAVEFNNLCLEPICRNSGCLTFTRRNWLVVSCNKWDASIFHGEKGLELVKMERTHIFHSEIPFRNFGLPFKKSRFPEKISVWGDKKSISPFKFHPKFPEFLGKW